MKSDWLALTLWFVARPDKTAHQQALSVLDEEIKTLTQKRTKLQTAVRDAEAGGGAFGFRGRVAIRNAG